MHRAAFAFVYVLATISLRQGQKISTNFEPKCKLNDREFLQCWKRAVENLKPYLIKGIPELKIPPIEPLRAVPFTVNRNVSSVAVYHAVVTDFYYTGARNFEIVDYHVDPDALTLRVKVRLPSLNVAGSGSAKGTVYGTAFANEGRAHGKFTNLVVDLLLNGGKYNKDGNFYVKWKKTSNDVKYDNFQIVFKDNFENVKGRAITERINKNIALFESHVTPIVKYTTEYFIINAVNNGHAKYPFNVLYPAI